MNTLHAREGIGLTRYLQIGTHVHAIVGASGFKNVYNPDELVQSNCTTIPVQPDKSNYWAVSSNDEIKIGFRHLLSCSSASNVPSGPAG